MAFVTRERKCGQMQGHRLEKNRRRIRWNTMRIIFESRTTQVVAH